MYVVNEKGRIKWRRVSCEYFHKIWVGCVLEMWRFHLYEKAPSKAEIVCLEKLCDTSNSVLE